MRFGIAFQTNKTPAEYAVLAQLVDRLPFDVVSVYNDLGFQPALGPLLMMAPHLHRATLGPAALNPFLVHPVEIAGQAAVLDLATNGRAYLGLARGAWLDRAGVHPHQGVEALRDAIHIVGQLLSRRTQRYNGTVFTLAEDLVLGYQPLRADPPIMVGTWGDRAAELAGELAREVKVGGSANPGVAPRIRAAIKRGERRAGRPAGTVGLCFGAVTVVDRDGPTARALARREIALYLPVVAKLDRQSDPEWLARVSAAAARGDADAVVRDVSDEILARFAFAGTPDDIVQQVVALAAAGVDRVELGTPHGQRPDEAIKLLGQQVVPQVHALLGDPT
ncbi:MAG: LLM class flavin-dependent oxidoreductase [Chloroflexota bacterium]